MISREQKNNLDKPIIIVVFMLVLIGIIMIAAAKQVIQIDPESKKRLIDITTENFSVVKMQIIWFLLSLVIMIATLKFDYRMLKDYVIHFYILNMIFLIAVLIPGIGQVRGGARRWIGLGPANFQPSELAKLFIIIIGAYLFEKYKDELNNPKILIKIGFILAFPILLVFVQPHLSGSIILFSIIISLFFIAGVKYRYFIYFGIFAIIAAFPTYFFILQDYQRGRVKALLRPDQYALEQAFQTNQSITIIGSGMQYGRGIGMNTMHLPEGHTDFIFSIIGAQLGFVGAVFVIILFFILIYRCIGIATATRELFDSYLVTGIAAMWAFQVFFNIGVTVGILPNTGIPLPFVSYGGSSLLIQMICVGLVLSVGIRSQKRFF